MKKYIIVLLISLLFGFKANSKIIKVKANPQKGFYFPYFLKIPKNTNANYIIVESNNTKKSKSLPSRSTRESIGEYGYSLGLKIANKLKYPLLMPIFPYASKEMTNTLTEKVADKYYIKQLDSDTLKITNEKYKRVDLQLIAMVDDAREKLSKEYNLKLKEKFIITGYSSASLFAARFTFLNPARVKLAVGGGIGGLLPIPSNKINGIDATYPIGTHDFQKITGNVFDLESYKNTPQFYYQGTKDKSNPFRKGAEDLTDEEFEIVKKTFTDGLPFGDKWVSLELNTTMWKNSQKYIKALVDNIEFESPKNERHTISDKMISRSVEFIKRNLQ